MRRLLIVAGILAGAALTTSASAREPDLSLNPWPDLAPGETTRKTGTTQPFRANEQPPVTRVVDITQPTLDVFLAPRETRNGTIVLILPGGGFAKVVPDKEGSEAAEWLNRHGVSACVLSYRTHDGSQTPPWKRPLQDAQRSLSLIRSHADQWQINPQRVGLLGFSAGGQVAAILLSDLKARSYSQLDAIDQLPFAPDFSLLIYPWNIYDKQTRQLIEAVQVTAEVPPTFLVHTHDDASSSMGSVLFYARLKQLGVSAELHVYHNGGHGYGMRPIAGSDIHTWPDRATRWLDTQGLLSR